MGSNGNRVKQLLATARLHHRPEALQDAVEELLTAEGKTGTASTELRVLGAEVAIELQQWATASQLLRAAGASNETRLLRIRRVLCGVLVSMHDVDDQETLSAEEKVQEKLNGMTTVLQTVADAVEMWPDSVDAVLIGIRTLWAIISPLLDAGRHAEVCDAVVFLASLHQQLHIGGGYTLVQWMARSGLCLYAADRVGEAFAHFSTAMDAAAILSNQRLYVQLLRMSASVVSAKERAAASAKGRSEFLGAYRSRPVVYGVLLTQLIFTGVMDVENCRDELHSTYETIHSGNSEVVLPAEVGAAVGKNKKKPPATKQQAPPTRMTETFTVTDPDVVDEVKSDLLLCISLFDTLTPQQLEELERKRHSSNRRVRSFTAFALYLHEGRERGVTVLQTCADASVLRPSHHVDANYFVQNVLSVLKTTDAIHDESERQYTLHVGVTLLWNHLLPVLQSSFAAEVQPAMDVILAAAEAAIPQLRPLFLQIGLQQCHIAYNEDHRATLHHLLPLLQRERARDAARSPNSQLQFALQWMQHQLAILEEPESSLTCQADRCLFAIEQARTVSNPTKRIPFLKAAFQHLPLLVREEPPSEAAVRDAPKKQTGHNAPQQQQQQQQQQQAAVPTQAVPSLRRSTVQLYKELLDLCMEDLSPSLYTVASTVADALRSLPGPPPGLSADDLEELQATASLHSATLLWRQLEDEADSVAEKTGAKSARRTREALLAGLLKETAQRAAALEGRRGGSGSWIVANACLTFLAMKQRDYLAGNYSTHMAELLELHSSYAALFVRGRAQDVALLSDLTVAAVVGLLAGFVASKAAAAAAVAPTSPASPVRSGSTAQQEASYAALIRRIQACVTVESSNPQLRKAETLCREGLQLIPAPRHKWFLAMLYPTVLRLANEKPVVAIHPQEELLFHLGVLAGPALTPAERQALQEQEMWPLLRRDPSVRLCAWVAAIAAEMQLEEAVLECCQIADSLYAEGRLGWDSNCDVVRSTGALGAAGGVGAAGRLGENGTVSSGTAALGATLSSMNGVGNKKVSMSMVLVQREATSPVKPDMDDWGAYAQLLAMKTRVCANHLQGLSGDVRRVALQQLFTNCVNSVIAVIHGPPAARAEHFTRAFSAYYSIVRDNNSVVPLSEAGFILPSLRMLLSKAILTQIPKREWSATFTELVYQLGAILVYVSYSSGRDDDVQQLTTHLRLLRELLPPRYQKSLRVRETTEVCYRNPTVDGFLHVSRNMEVEVQAHGWLIVAQRAGDEASAAEAFALALAGTQTNAFARAQCLFEFAYTSLQRGSAPLARAAAQLREALRTLEGLPESAALLHDTASDADSTKATLADKSLTASFLRTCRKRGPTSEVTATTREQQAVARAALSKKAANAAKGPHVNFQHLLLGLRIVALLFRVASPSLPHATGTGSAAVKASRSAAPATRRDCANVMLDYIASLWELCTKTLRDEEELAAVSQRSDRTVAGLLLPESATQFHGFTEAAGMAQRVRKLVPDEELQLNTQGVWQTVLELGDYLVFTGDEAHAFMVYAWLRFSAEMSLGGPESSAACAQVHRVCNLRMSIASVMGGLSDAPYKAALQRLSEVHLPLERHALVAPQRAGAPSPQAWLVAFVVAECEARVVLGQIEEAAALSLKFLVSDTHKDALSDAELHGLRIVAHNEIVRGRHDEALRMVDEALHGMQSHRSAFEPNGHFAVDTWIKLCDVKLRALLNKKAGKEAVQWLVAVRGQLTEWRAAAALASKTANTLHTIGLQAELSNAVQYWARELMDCAFHSNPSAAALQAFPVAEGPIRGAALEIYREVLAITEDAETLHIRLYRAAAQWRLRDRVSPRWAAQHASFPKEHLCPRLMTLLAEKKALHLLRESVEAVMPQQREGDAGRPVATSFGLWRAFLLYWEAVGHLEANHVVECLLSTFRQLSMHDLQLPTTDAPPHLEKEVLRFIRGGMEEEKAADADAAAAASATAASSPTRAKVGARWQHTPKVAMAEMEQALQYYGMPVKEATAVADLSTVLPLVDRALAMARPWSHSRLACAFLNTCAEIEVLRLAENQIPAADDMVGEKLESQREAVITAAWNRAPLIPPKTDKANNRSRKSISSLRQRGSNEASLTLTAPMLSSAEQDMLQRVKDGAEEAVRHMHIDMAEMLYDSLGNLAILLGRPRLAAAAAEQMQACQLVGLLHAKSTQEMADCAEGRLWRQYASLHPLLRGASPCRALLEDVLSLSPMGRYIRSCATLCVEEKKDDEVIPPSSHGRDAAPVEASPFVVDAPVLTIALSTLHPSTCLVLLRHTDGAVEGRRRALAESEWRLLVRQVEEVRSHTAELLGSDKGGRLGSAAQRITSEDAASVLDPLAPTTSKLLLDFQPSLQSSGAKSPLYLCLGPGVQAFAWEQTSVLAACSVVVRELSAAVVVSKYNEPSRTVRRPSTHNTKSSAAAPPKSVAAGPSVCIVDAFGDHTESIENVFSGDSAKLKSTQHIFVTCSEPGSPPDPCYVAWVLNASAPSSMVVDMCGSFADVLPLSHLATLRLSQLNVAVMADGAVNVNSRQREERKQLGGGSADSDTAAFAPPRWLVQLLLLVRGARFVVANTFPCSPETSDGLTRRCLSSLASAKTLVEQLRGKAKDTKTPLVTLYGAFGNTGKQKA